MEAIADLAELVLDYREYFAALDSLRHGDYGLAIALGADVQGPDGGGDFMSGYRDGLDERLEEIVMRAEPSGRCGHAPNL